MYPGVRLSVFSANPGGGSRVLWASLLEIQQRARETTYLHQQHNNSSALARNYLEIVRRPQSNYNSKQQQATTASNYSKQLQQATTASNYSKQLQQALHQHQATTSTQLTQQALQTTTSASNCNTNNYITKQPKQARTPSSNYNIK